MMNEEKNKKEKGITEDELQALLRDIPVKRNEAAEEDARIEEKKNRVIARQKKYPDKLAFALGVVIFVFALAGIGFSVFFGIKLFTAGDEKTNEFASYNEFLAPVAAVDADPFDDITASDRQQLLGAAIWSILSNEATPDTYPYKGGYMLIPARDVESAYISIFGPETAQSLKHTTVQGYNSTFEYDETNAVYKIPVTTISPVYTPQVTAVERSGTSLIVTVNYLASESWQRDEEGNFIAPEPDKVMQITLREISGSYYIGAIQTVSSTVPETVTFEAQTQETVSSEAEKTTSQNSEKTTLGGRV